MRQYVINLYTIFLRQRIQRGQEGLSEEEKKDLRLQAPTFGYD